MAPVVAAGTPVVVEPPKKPMLPATRTEAIPSDPYRWLEDEKSPEVQAWMKLQDTFTRDRINELPARARLLARYRELYYLDSMGAPVKRGGR